MVEIPSIRACVLFLIAGNSSLKAYETKLCTLYRSSLRNDLDKTTYGTIFDIDRNLKTISLRSLVRLLVISVFFFMIMHMLV